MTRFVVVFAVLWITLSIYAQDYSPEFESTECPYFMQVIATDSDLTIWCGNLFVPENRADVDNLQLELFFAYVESKTETNNAPIVYLEGGPGGAASAWVAEWADFKLLDTYDVIFIDQRGTGLSEPSLNCPEFEEIEDEDEWIIACRERLIDEGIDLNMYNSVTNANDIQDLLVALDIPQANLYGSSYGVRLALTMMRDFPERIRAVMIDAVYPPQVDSLVVQSTFTNQAFEQLFADCELDTQCNTAYPNLRDAFYRAIETMNDAPAEVYDYEYDAYFEMNGDDFANEVFNRLYDSAELPYLPAVITAFANGEYDYDPLIDHQQRILEAQIRSDTIEPDEVDLYVMETYQFDTADDLYAYYFTLSDEEFEDLLYEVDDALYYTPFMNYLELRSIDEAIDYVDELDDDTYFELEAWVTGYYDDDSEGMYYSVECAEEILFYTEADVIAFSEPLPDVIEDALNASVTVGFHECELWDVEQANQIETQPVASDIPTLIYSGAYDPITPAQWGEDTGQYLPNSWHYVFPNAGHGAFETSDCALDIGLAFLSNPSQKPDDACFADLTAPEFFIR